MACASAVRKKRLFISYSSPSQDEFEQKLEKDLEGANFDVVTNVTMPARLRETIEEWSQRVYNSVDVVLVLMSDDYQKDRECKQEADAASKMMAKTGNPQMAFILADEKMNENDWLKTVKGKSRDIDLSSGKYNRNVKALMNILSQCPEAYEIHGTYLILITYFCNHIDWIELRLLFSSGRIAIKFIQVIILSIQSCFPVPLTNYLHSCRVLPAICDSCISPPYKIGKNMKTGDPAHYKYKIFFLLQNLQAQVILFKT